MPATTFPTLDLPHAKPFYKVGTRHEHHFVPALNYNGRLIGVCNDDNCTVTLSFDEIIERMNGKDWEEK